MNVEDFKPINEEERIWIEQYNTISDYTSKSLRALSEEKRLPYLRTSAPSNLSLMNLYIRSIKKEDYETTAVAKALLIERRITQFPS